MSNSTFSLTTLPSTTILSTSTIPTVSLTTTSLTSSVATITSSTSPSSTSSSSDDESSSTPSFISTTLTASSLDPSDTEIALAPTSAPEEEGEGVEIVEEGPGGERKTYTSFATVIADEPTGVQQEEGAQMTDLVNAGPKLSAGSWMMAALGLVTFVAQFA